MLLTAIINLQLSMDWVDAVFGLVSKASVMKILCHTNMKNVVINRVNLHLAGVSCSIVSHHKIMHVRHK